VTKGPRRAELSGEDINTVTSSSTATEEIESREYHGINKPRMPLVILFFSQEIDNCFLKIFY